MRETEMMIQVQISLSSSVFPAFTCTLPRIFFENKCAAVPDSMAKQIFGKPPTNVQAVGGNFRVEAAAMIIMPSKKIGIHDESKMFLMKKRPV